MKEFLSKLSLYDFLTTILLGGCICIPIFLCIHGKFCCSSCCYSWRDFVTMFNINTAIAIAVAFLYLIGLMSHKIIEAIDFSLFINKVDQRQSIILMAVLSIICRNQKSIINKARMDLKLEAGEKDAMDDYYETYYKALINDHLNNIPKIEAHSALIKDLCFILPFIVFWITLCSNMCLCHKFCTITSGLIIEALLVAVRYNSEYKIHSLIWEYKKYCLDNLSINRQ